MTAATATLTIPAVLRRAAAILDRDGWCQGRFQSPKGQHCIIGALRVAVGGTIRYSDMRTEQQAIIDEVDDLLEARFGTVPERWNDELGRTSSDVKAELLAAAAELEAQP